MELKDWLIGGYGRVTMLARGVNVPVSFVSKIKLGKKPIPASLCPAIEEFTEREVRCEDMRPDVKWHVLRDGPRSMHAPAADGAVTVQMIAAPDAANDVALDAPGRA